MIRIDNLQKSNVSELDEFKWNGFYRALVLDAHDERQLGRVKVRIPDLMPEDGAEDCGPWDEMGLWAHPANNYMGGRNIQDTMGTRADFDDAWYQGSCLIPPKGSWVWIFFECGDPNHPYYFGAGDFGQRKVLPENQNGAEWEKKWTLYKSREGRCIIISDDPDDCRVEITGKKRMISNEPDGDLDSVFEIDGNQTVIFLDEREGKENLLIKDYRGNFIRMHIDNLGVKDQLHVFFQDDIHIETLKNMFIRTGLDMNVHIGKQYKRFVTTQTDTYCMGPHHETALRFDRNAFLVDSTHAGVTIFEKAGADNVSIAGGMMVERSVGMNERSTDDMIQDKAAADIHIDAGAELDLLAAALVKINGSATHVQMGAAAAAITLPVFIAPVIAKIAKKAEPLGERNQDPIPQDVPDPVMSDGITVPLPTFVTTPELGDPYEKTFEDIPPTEPQPNHPVSEIPVSPIIITPSSGGGSDAGGGGGGGSEEETPILEGGVGHIYMLELKDEYRDKIIPLIYNSYGKYVSFSIFKDPISDNQTMHYNADSQFMDPESIPVYKTYRATSGVDYDWEIDDSTKWWTNLDEVCQQARNRDLTIVPTLFDFYDSPKSPFVTEAEGKPYSETSWNPITYGPMLKKVCQHIKSSGVKYILNIGYRSYVQSKSIQDIYPDRGFIKKLISYLVEECGVSVNELALSANETSNLYGKMSMSRYKSYHGKTYVGEDQINIEEYVDSNWGGTGRVSVKDAKDNLIDGYEYFLRQCNKGIPVMSTWKMSSFLNEVPQSSEPENIMNYIFAPRQRAAMRLVYGDGQSDGFTDFS